jgi:prolactin regulatory element-binding protein
MAGDVEDYQKVTVISPDAGYLAVAGNRDLSLLTYPLLGLAAQPIHTTHDIYDATFSSTTLIIATTHNLLVYALPSRPTESPTSSPSKSKAKNRKRGKQRGGSKSQLEPQLELLRTIELPALPGGMVEGATFRAARFHPHISTTLYTIVNTSPPRTRKTKSAPRPAFVVKWTIPIDLNDEWEIRVRKVGEKGVTCFDVSPDGRLLAFGSSDFTIGILDTNTLGPLLTILKAHEFPPTTLRFNPTSTLLVSGSADNSVRIISVPAELGGQFWGTLTVIILTLLVILSAIAYQMLQ